MSKPGRVSRAEPLPQPRGRGAAARGVWLWAMLLALAPHAAGESPEPAVKEILARMPSGSRAAQAAWLLAEARGQSDAEIAKWLMDEVLRRGEGATSVEARLWKTRYWMVAGRPQAAAGELELLGELSPGSPAAAQANYWRALNGAPVSPSATGSSGAPSWDLLAQLASLDAEAIQRSPMRLVLSLEGGARRWGLLGPWLWRLQQSDVAALGRVVADLCAASPSELARAPERSALLGGGRGSGSREDREEAGDQKPPGAGRGSAPDDR